MERIILDKNKLIEGAKALKLDLTETQIQQIEEYLLRLQKWNGVYNLTAIHHPDQMLTHHVLDSLSVGRFLNAKTYLDVGTGPGLPGMMLAILLPEKQFTLLDSNSKKTSFARQTAYHLGLENVTVETCRVEDYEPESPFDGVITRAFSSLTDFIDLCTRFVKKDGELLAMKGPKATDETKNLKQPCKIEKIKVPFLEEERFLVRIERI